MVESVAAINDGAAEPALSEALDRFLAAAALVGEGILVLLGDRGGAASVEGAAVCSLAVPLSSLVDFFLETAATADAVIGGETAILVV